MSGELLTWSWRLKRQIRVAIRRGDRRYAEHRRELPEQTAAKRQQALAAESQR